MINDLLFYNPHSSGGNTCSFEWGSDGRVKFRAQDCEAFVPSLHEVAFDRGGRSQLSWTIPLDAGEPRLYAVNVPSYRSATAQRLSVMCFHH